MKKPLQKQLNEESVKLYIGFDPTADSLHRASTPNLMLRRFQQNGHVHCFSWCGTGMIGDPSFKDAERSLNTLDTVKAWSESIKASCHVLSIFEDEKI